MNNDTRYSVTKISVKDANKPRFVQQGFKITGVVTAEVGQPMYVQGRGFSDNLQTTPVMKITPGVGENFIVETVSSVYSLEKIDSGN